MTQISAKPKPVVTKLTFDLGKWEEKIEPLYTSTLKHLTESMEKVTNKRNIFECIKQDLHVLKMDIQAEVLNYSEQELEDWECQQQQDAIKEVNLNYQKIPTSIKNSLIKRIGWEKNS